MNILIKFMKEYINNILTTIKNKIVYSSNKNIKIEFTYIKISNCFVENKNIKIDYKKSSYKQFKNKRDSALLLAQSKIILIKNLEQHVLQILNIGNPILVRCII